MKRMLVEIAVPDGDELDAELLRKTVATISTSGLEHEHVVALLLATAETLVRAETLALVSADMPGTPMEAATALSFTSSRLRVVDEIMHLPEADMALRLHAD